MTDDVFVDASVPNNGIDYILTVYVTVDEPLPYTLDADHQCGLAEQYRYAAKVRQRDRLS